jgi:hypothetical protein
VHVTSLPFLGARLALLIATLGTLCGPAHAGTKEYGFEQKLYVAVPLANVRTAPRQDAPVKGELLAGRDVTYLGKPGDDMLPDQCKDDARSDGKDWLCVRPDYLPIDTDGGDLYWAGWVRADTLAHTAPAIPRLVDQGRTAMPAREPATIYAFTAGYLEPIGQRRNGVLSDSLAPGTGHAFYRRGMWYALYSGGRHAGSVVTDIQLECLVALCPGGTLVRALPFPGSPRIRSGVATDAKLAGNGLPSAEPDRDQKAVLAKLAQRWVQASAWTAREKKAFLDAMQKGRLETVLKAGQLSADGKRVLFGSWVLGRSMDDAHYGDPEDLYASLLIIAEPGADGRYRAVPGSGALTEEGCKYFEHLDLDDDGTDELVLRCDQLEGSYHYTILRKAGPEWKPVHGDTPAPLVGLHWPGTR